MKNLWIKILFTGIIVLALIFTTTYIFLLFQGRAIITKQLEAFTKKKVSMGYFGITPPLNLQIKSLNIEGLAKVDSVSISPNLFGLLFGKMALNDIKIIKPELTYEKIMPEAVEPTAAAPSNSTSSISVPPKVTPSLSPIQGLKKSEPLCLVFKHLNIKDGKINFVDHTVGPEGIQITVKDINFDLTNLYLLPRSAITNFELKGKIPWKEGQEEGRIEAEGWINFFKKDMQATLKIEEINGIYFYPYYANWVDLEKARIESAKLNLTSNIQGFNNNVTAECHLELTDIVRKPRAPEEEVAKAEKIADAVLDIFRALNQGKIVLDFTIRTKMDRPEFGFGNIKMAFENKLAQGRKLNGFKAQDVLSLPANLVQGTFKGLTDLTTAVIGGTISAGKQIGQAIEDSIKKEEKKQE